MYNRIYNFSNNNFINPWQFGFRQKYSAVRALIIIFVSIRKNLDDENTVYGIFVDLQQAFDTVKHDILLSKLKFGGLFGLANE